MAAIDKICRCGQPRSLHSAEKPFTIDDDLGLLTGGERTGHHHVCSGFKAMRSSAPRTDPHRKGAFIPAHYQYRFSYWIGSMGAPSINVNLVVDLRAKGANFFEGSDLGKCAACGAFFLEGDVWYHEPSGEHIHLGHDCADKYGLMTDRSELELEMDRAKAARAVEVEKARKAEERSAFLAAHPGLAEDFEDGKSHNIVASIHSRFVQWCSISQKQIDLVHKLAEEIRNPAPKEAEAPKAEPVSGRATVRGTVLAVKSYDSDWGTTFKMLVVFRTPEGAEWKAFGTEPRSIEGYKSYEQPLKGKTIEFTATFERKEEGFAYFSRPTKARILSEDSTT